MPNEQEKEHRKHIRDQLKQQERDSFVQSLPVNQEVFKQLFDYLDAELQLHACDHTDTLTRYFLDKTCANADEVIEWLNEHGGFCDCEIVWNVEQVFQDMNSAS
jgi:hypothetical protein